VTVDFMTLDGTATAGVDYVGTNGTLTFPANTAVRLITIPIKSDSATETNDTFSVVLKNPQGGVLLGLKTNLLVTIQDAPDPAAIPLTRAPFLSQTARPMMNTTFSRNFSVSPGSAGHVMNGSFDSSINRLSVSGIVAGATGQEGMQLSLYGVTGPGVFNVSRPGNTADCAYTHAAISGSFAWVSNATGVGSGTITLDGFNGTRATGRYDLILADDSDNTKTIHVVGSFSTNVQ